LSNSLDPTEVVTILVLEDVIIAGSTGIGLISIFSGEILARQEGEICSFLC
jgi:hypothetical protein